MEGYDGVNALSGADNGAGARVAAAAGYQQARRYQLTPPKSLNYVSTATAFYELHAPNKRELASAQLQLDLAAVRFRKHFGRVLPIIVTLFASPRDYNSSGVGKFFSKLPIVIIYSQDYYRSSGSLKNNSLGLKEIVAHEAGHMFFNELFNEALYSQAADTAKLKSDRYGHAFAPDWFDECAATLCESQELRQWRWSGLRKGISRMIPLKQLFTMSNPAMETVRKEDKENPNPTAEPRIYKLSEEDRVQSELFYAQAQAVGLFLLQRGGRDTFGAIIKGILAGDSMDAILARSKGLPRNVVALERQLTRWVRQNASAPR